MAVKSDMNAGTLLKESDISVDKILEASYKSYMITSKDQIIDRYSDKKLYSGEFYSNGSAEKIVTKKELESIMETHNKFYFIVLNKRLKDIPEAYKTQLAFLESNYKTSIFLYKK